MNPVATSVETQWHISFGSGAAGTLADAFLFYVAALLLITYLGAGMGALTLPNRIRPFGWMAVPFLGFSVLVTVSGLTVAVGANMRIALAISLTMATTANVWAFTHRRSTGALGHLRGLLGFAALSLPSYAITAFSMFHNGSLAYVGGQLDIHHLVPLSEWLKDHSAALISLSPSLHLDPNWDANIPPFGGWLAEGAHLAHSQAPKHETLLVFIRGPIYFQSALTILLGWDSYLLLRSTLAFLLSLSIPGAFLFCRLLIGIRTRASLLAALLLGLNGTVFYWVIFGHPGQAVWAGLLPISLLATASALESRSRAPVICASLILVALLASYYQAAPLLAVLMAGLFAFSLASSRTRIQLLVKSVLVAIGVLLAGFPEHIMLLLAVANGNMFETPGWGDPQVVPFSDALGTTLYYRASQLVAGQGQLGDGMLRLIQCLSLTGTAVATALALLGMVRGKAVAIGMFRLMSLAVLAMMSYLLLTGYLYGYAKGQAMATFLVAGAIAMGADCFWEWWTTFSETERRRHLAGKVVSGVALGGTGFMLGAMIIGLTLAAFGFWKPVGNIWNTAAWSVGDLGERLQTGEEVRLSPNILADPESTFAIIYSLRRQSLQGALVFDRPLGKAAVLSEVTGRSNPPPPTVDVLGASEVAATAGFKPSDEIWAGPIVSAYRHISDSIGVAVQPEDDPTSPPALPCRLPATLTVGGSKSPGEGQQPDRGEGYLALTLASDSPTKIEITIGEVSKVISVSEGAAVRYLPVATGDRVSIGAEGGANTWIISAVARSGKVDPSTDKDYPRVLAAAGSSAQDGNTISTRFTYLDIGVPVSHSLDVYGANDDNRVGWFELPTNPDGRVKAIGFDLDTTTMGSRDSLDGSDASRRSIASPIGDGKYIAYFSIWAGPVQAKRVPLYIFTLAGGKLTDFRPLPLLAVWDGSSPR